MAPSAPTARSRAARVAALERWSRQDPVAGTAPAREAFLARFERQVDPDGVLEPAERTRRAERAKRAYFIKLNAKSHAARRARAEAGAA